ncbi:DMT family transporter [Granulicoccus sp. GXG6511]|uniref:DMT family transporter n=1 Tax=Granulicoccus sp. GXG6511 TaxID=3381351 RepID=UPI003D7DB07D
MSDALGERRAPIGPHPGRGLGALVIAGIAWGSSGTLGTLLTRSSGLSLMAAGGYRIAVGGLLVAAFVLVTRQLRLPTRRAGWVRVFGIAGCSALYQVAFFTAIGSIGVALSTLVAIGSAPILVLLVDAATGRHRLDLRSVGTVAMALGGLVLLVGTPPLGVTPNALLGGVGLALLAGVGFAGISLLGGRPEPDFQNLTGTALAFLIGGVVVLLLASVVGPVTFTPTPRSLLLVVALGLVPTAVAYLAYLHGLRTHSSTTGVLVSLLEPLTAALLAAILLGEWLTTPALVGAALLLGAVTLTATGTRRRPTPEPGKLG